METDILGNSDELYYELSGTAQEDRIKNYVLNNYENAKQAGKKYGLNPVAILTQGSIESGWGTSHIAKEHKNYFGITAYGSTNEYWKGGKYISKSSGLPFRSYARPQDSFMDYARLITSKYTTAAKNSFNIEAYAQAIAYSPYLSDKHGDNRPVYKTLIIKNAATIEKAIRENNLLRTGRGTFGSILGFAALFFLGWVGYDYFLNEDENGNTIKP